MADSQYSFDVTSENFSEVVLEKSKQVPVLVDFWATWCGPCQALMPVLAKLADEYQGKFILAKVNSDEQQELAAQFAVRSIPTVKIFRNGEVVDEFTGAQPESAIKEILGKYIERPIDKIRNQAIEAIQQGDMDTAVELMEKVVEEDPDNDHARLELVSLYMKTGNMEKAETAFNQIPIDKQMEGQGKRIRASLELNRVLQDAPDTRQLEETLEQDPGNLDATYKLGARKIQEQDYASALELFLSIVKKDRGFMDDIGRKSMLMVFELLGDDDDLTKTYRRKLAMYLY